MATIDINCAACCELEEHAPEFVEEGVTETVCESLQNNTGLNPAAEVLHDNAQDYDLMNDCLVGRLDGILDAFGICEWQDFMHKAIPNLYTLLKAIGCMLAGIQAKLESIGTDAYYEPQIQYARGSGTTSRDYYVASGTPQTISFNEANREENNGAIIAPFDGICIISYCSDLQDNVPNPNNNANTHKITFYTNNEHFSQAMEDERAMHFGITDKEESVSMSCALKMKAGEYARCYIAPSGTQAATTGKYRIHQIVAVFIPKFEVHLGA